ncbi:DNA-processing protein DprA [Facklamia miroungae]|uniref:DNA processing protein n=1 Tax=Facklamia miroungae TaxID=120956 RepID=A0A1G7P7I1_9LACT|nr:DNA-processing protein DprA [Facklamia miroungae]NKZ28609.1 DNA-protecting protein DprA [Facklamia miroungae]SDF82228.1 DNA processing protein [Facklamia miroungae]
MIKKELIYLQLKGLKYRFIWQYFKWRTHYSRQETLEYLINKSLCSTKIWQLFNEWDTYQERLSYLEKMCIMFGEDAYPERWIQLPQPPFLFYYRGRLSYLRNPLVAIIGSRKLSNYGRKSTIQISQAISRAGFVVVSGLARGVDYLSHLACLNQAQGKTIAILPNGFDIYYPKDHQSMQETIAQKHLLISEYPPHQGVRKHQFIARNRLVAGLCPTVIVIQAAQKSGSLITANYALDYNSQIYALPGPIDDVQSFGTNALIQAGARPIVDIPSFISEMKQDYQRQKGN